MTYIEEYKDDNAKAVAVASYEIYVSRLKKIQMIIEDALGYHVETAIEKCRKKAQKKYADIGEDALVLASRVKKDKEKK